MTTLIVPEPRTTLIEREPVVLPVTEINWGTAFRLLEEAVQTKGRHHVQDVCVYGVTTQESDYNEGEQETVEANTLRPATEPGCIVGVVLWNLLGPEAFDAYVVKTGNNGNTFDRFWQDVPGYSFTPRAARLLIIAQTLQDGRGRIKGGEKIAWGEAADAAVALTCIPLPGVDGDESY